MPLTLPGENNPNTPPLPNIEGQNASAETLAAVARWNGQITFNPIPPDLKTLLEQHPEYLTWAAGSIVGSMRFAQ